MRPVGPGETLARSGLKRPCPCRSAREAVSCFHHGGRLGRRRICAAATIETKERREQRAAAAASACISRLFPSINGGEASKRAAARQRMPAGQPLLCGVFSSGPPRSSGFISAAAAGASGAPQSAARLATHPFCDHHPGSGIRMVGISMAWFSRSRKQEKTQYLPHQPHFGQSDSTRDQLAPKAWFCSEFTKTLIPRRRLWRRSDQRI